jgi:hypothetical protein
MKKTILFSLILFSCFLLKGQDVKSDSTKFTYCEIVGTKKLLSTKVTVVIDFGQSTKWFSDNRYKDPATGKPYVFNSMVDALNFMGINRWEFVQAYTIGDAQNGYVYHFLLKRQTSSLDNEI